MMNYLIALLTIVLCIALDLPIETLSLAAMPFMAVKNGEEPSGGGIENILAEFDGEGGKPEEEEEDAGIIEEPEPEEEEEHEADDPDPEPEEDDNPEDVKDKKKEKPKGEEDSDLVEHEGEKFFYHPEVHAKGEKTHPNFYKSRDKAEDAAVAKIDRINSRLEKLKELKSGVGALRVPSLLDGKLDEVIDLADHANFVSMDAETLRATLKDLDQFDMRLENKISRKDEKAQEFQLTEEMEQTKDETIKFAQQLMQFDQDLGKRIQEESHRGIEVFQEAVDKAVEQQLADDQAALDDWVEEQDETGALSNREFLKQMREKEKALNGKREKLKQSYKPGLETAKKFIENLNKAAQAPTKKLSREQVVKQASATFDEFVDDVGEEIEIFKTDSRGNPKHVEPIQAFQRFALNPSRIEEFNNFSDVRDWLKAWDSYNEYKETLRAERQTDKMKSGKKKEVAQKPRPKKKERKGRRSDNRSEDPFVEQNEQLLEQFDALVQ